MMIRRFGIMMTLILTLILISCSETKKQTTTTVESTTTTTTMTTEQTTTTTTEPTTNYYLYIHYIDVGQADSILIELPNDENMLIDAGNNDDGDEVVSYLQALNIIKLDYLIGTHPHEDHIGGLDDVINAFDIEEIYLPDKASTTNTYLDVLEAIDNKNLTITEAMDGITLFDEMVGNQILKAVMLSPISNSYSETNNYSPIIKLTYGNHSYLFTGDAEKEVEQEVLAKGYDISCDVLKLGHHGSVTSTSQAFLDAVSPTYGIISVGLNNTYGHPDPEIIERLEDAGVQIYRTDEAGTIVIESNGDTLDISTENVHYEPNPEETTTTEDGEQTTTTTEMTTNPPIVINEILPAPKVTYTQEWVELYNTTDYAIDISGYKIDDIENGGMDIMTIADGTTIPPHGYYVFYCTSVFNNSGDDVRLLDDNNQLIDLFTYGDSEYDQSFYRTTDGGNWGSSQTSNPTPNNSN